MRALPTIAIVAASGLSFFLGTLRPPVASGNAQDSSNKTFPTALGAGEASPVADIRKLLGARPTRERAASLHLAVLSLDADGLKALWDSGIDLARGGDTELAEQVIRRLATLDPEAAIARANAAGAQKYRFLMVALAGWATVDPDAAADWCRAQSDPRARQRGLVAVIESLGDSDPAAAVELFLACAAEKSLPAVRWHAGDFFRHAGRNTTPPPPPPPR